VNVEGVLPTAACRSTTTKESPRGARFPQFHTGFGSCITYDTLNRCAVNLLFRPRRFREPDVPTRRQFTSWFRFFPQNGRLREALTRPDRKKGRSLQTVSREQRRPDETRIVSERRQQQSNMAILFRQGTPDAFQQ
jgi:hypothetical protein